MKYDQHNIKLDIHVFVIINQKCILLRRKQILQHLKSWTVNIVILQLYDKEFHPALNFDFVVGIGSVLTSKIFAVLDIDPVINAVLALDKSKFYMRFCTPTLSDWS